MNIGAKAAVKNLKSGKSFPMRLWRSAVTAAARHAV
jgi:hypothetical protein